MRKRSNSYDYEADMPSQYFVAPKRPETKGRKRLLQRRNQVLVCVGLLTLAGLFVAKASKKKKSRAEEVAYVRWAAHSSAASQLREELQRRTKSSQALTKRRREGYGGQSEVAARKERPARPEVVPSEEEERSLEVSVSEMALDLLESRLLRAEREEERQRAVSAREGADFLKYASNGFCAADIPEKDVFLRFASLNMWQPAADTWPERRAAIAEILKSVDVVAAQEVRGGAVSWAQEMAKELAMKFMYVPGFGTKSVFGGGKPDGWTEEGVAIFSKFDIRAESVVGMPPGPKSSDKNPRATLGVIVETHLGPVRVVASHLSYDRRQQCDAVSEKLKPWLDDLWETHDKDESLGQVLLGDLNTYPDFEWPIDFLTKSPQLVEALGNPCVGTTRIESSKTESLFRDAWEVLSSDKTDDDDVSNPNGWTFPNPETMDLDPARPDRLLVRSEKIIPTATYILGCDALDSNQIIGRAKATRPSDHRILVVDFEKASSSSRK